MTTTATLHLAVVAAVARRLLVVSPRGVADRHHVLTHLAEQAA